MAGNLTKPSAFNVNWQEVAWISAIVSLGMLAQWLLQLRISAHLALFPVMAATLVRDYSPLGLVKQFLPTIATAAGALLLCDIFAAHPAVIWSISLFVFDRVRCWADTPAKQSRAMAPLLNWFLVVVFFQHSSVPMTEWLRCMVTALLVTIVVVQLVRVFLPVPQRPLPPAVAPMAATYQQRLVFVLLLGSGLAFLMMVDLAAATFCMMPVITAAGQVQRQGYQAVLRSTLQGHVGGCALAMIFITLLLGQYSHFMVYGTALVALVTLMAYWICASSGAVRVLHNQGLLGTMLPLQLYLSSSDWGLQDTFHRGGYLLVVLLLLFAVQGAIYGSKGAADDHRH
ncbi:DUF2955 domain-containing protein [Ferrimonas senticii]|uniref:DUF2955 domain-containing protein n=1 Tax=Ferrimonas senticii TaxID=394566 RepID=UPI00040F58C7|nr:DUF2955 domain-containing protein [Ferrimonas senticii]